MRFSRAYSQDTRAHCGHEYVCTFRVRTRLSRSLNAFAQKQGPSPSCVALNGIFPSGTHGDRVTAGEKLEVIGRLAARSEGQRLKQLHTVLQRDLKAAGSDLQYKIERALSCPTDRVGPW